MSFARRYAEQGDHEVSGAGATGPGRRHGKRKRMKQVELLDVSRSAAGVADDPVPAAELRVGGVVNG